MSGTGEAPPPAPVPSSAVVSTPPKNPAPPDAAAREDDFIYYLHRGSELLQARRPEDARVALERAFQLAPQNPKAQNLLGLVYFKLGLLEAAKSIYDRLVEEYPGEPPLYVNLGLVLLRQGRLNEAERALRKAISISPDHTRAHCYLGLVLYRRGDLAMSREHFLKGQAEDFARKVEQKLSQTGGARPSQAELLSEVAAHGFRNLDSSAMPFQPLDFAKDERVVRDEEAWEAMVTHDRPAGDSRNVALGMDANSLLPVWALTPLPTPAEDPSSIDSRAGRLVAPPAPVGVPFERGKRPVADTNPGVVSPWDEPTPVRPPQGVVTDDPWRDDGGTPHLDPIAQDTPVLPIRAQTNVRDPFVERARGPAIGRARDAIAKDRERERARALDRDLDRQVARDREREQQRDMSQEPRDRDHERARALDRELHRDRDPERDRDRADRSRELARERELEPGRAFRQSMSSNPAFDPDPSAMADLRTFPLPGALDDLPSPAEGLEMVEPPPIGKTPALGLPRMPRAAGIATPENVLAPSAARAAAAKIAPPAPRVPVSQSPMPDVIAREEASRDLPAPAPHRSSALAVNATVGQGAETPTPRAAPVTIADEGSLSNALSTALGYPVTAPSPPAGDAGARPEMPEAVLFGDSGPSTQDLIGTPREDAAAPSGAPRMPADTVRPATPPGFYAGPGSRARLIVEARAYLKSSAIVAASGRLVMTPAMSQLQGHATGTPFGDPADPMCLLEGRAVLLLRVPRIAVALRGVRDLHVVQSALVGFDSDFNWDNGKVLGIDVVTLRGSGSLLVDTRGAPMLIPVDTETPVHAARSAILAWSDGVRPSPVDGGNGEARLFRLRGRGYVLVAFPPESASGSITTRGGR